MAFSATLGWDTAPELVQSRLDLIELALEELGKEESCTLSPLQLFYRVTREGEVPAEPAAVHTAIYEKPGLWGPLDLWCLELCWSGSVERRDRIHRLEQRTYGLASKLLLHEAWRQGEQARLMSRNTRSRQYLERLKEAKGEVDAMLEKGWIR